MSFPHEDNNHANSLHEVREFLEARHPAQISSVQSIQDILMTTAQLNNQVCCSMEGDPIHVT